MDPATAAEALRQLWEGADFPAPASLLRGIKPDTACALPPGFKYSIATLVEHTHFWQRIWLGRLKDSRRPDMAKDWRVPSPEEWPEVRTAFLEGLQEALRIAETNPFEHKVKSDEAAVKTLLQIAIHGSYHVGQIVLIKRAVKSAGK